MPTPQKGGLWDTLNGPTYWVRALSFDPNLADSRFKSSHFIALGVDDEQTADIVVSVLNSSVFYLYFKTFSNCRDLTTREIETFPVPEISLTQSLALKQLTESLMQGYENGRSRQSRKYPSGYIEYYEYYPHQLKPTIDEIDSVLAELYGFTSHELEYIVQYQAKYR